MNEKIDPQLQTMINNMPEKTGKSLTEWFQVLSAAGLEKHGDMMKLLKGEHGVSHGFANTIALLFRQQAEGGPPAEEDLLSAQFAGGKAALRPIYDAIIAAINQFEGEYEVATKKTYISLRRKKQFAIVQASTQTRVDVGLNLKDISATERLEGGNVFSGMCSHRVKLTTPAEVDAELVAWLQTAYEQA